MIGSIVEEVAKESCGQVADAEVALSIDGGITIATDGGWQHRGFHSASGHCAAVGQETRKIVGYEVMSKECK